MRAELLICPGTALRGSRMLEALRDTAPIPIEVRQAYTGACEVLVTYGTGHPIRRPWWQQHRRRGGRAIGWDLGYWDRLGDDAGMRCTLDTDHPPQWIRREPARRWDARGVRLRADASPDGPIVLVGQGAKSVQVARERPLQWEQHQLAALRLAYPGHEVVFRPKRDTDPRPRGLRVLTGDIEDALRGASLVVCRHSNVAIDACIAGIPVVCDAGAASAIYGSDLCTPIPVTPNTRRTFLRSLAWWNWRPSEAAAAWTYLLNRIEQSSSP